jgi:integrase/recombinase XerD
MRVSSKVNRVWQAAPLQAFAEFVISDEYQRLGRRAASIDLRTGRPYVMAASSIKVLTAMFARFHRHIEAEGVSIGDVTSDHVLCFLNGHSRAKDARYLTSRIRVKYLQLLERVFTHLSLQPNPAQNAGFSLIDIPNGTGENLERQALTEKQTEQFIAALPGGPLTHWKKRRDSAMLAIILGGGLLPSETLVLRPSHVRLDRQTGKVTVLVKKQLASLKAEHTTVLHKFAVQIVLDWVAEHRARKLAGTRLFPPREHLRSPDERLDPATLYSCARRTFERAGLTVGHFGCRTLRNTFIERELAAGTPSDVLQQYLGLQEIDSVHLYDDHANARRIQERRRYRKKERDPRFAW